MSNIPSAPESRYGPGAEQDRYGARLGINPETVKDKVKDVKDAITSRPGAEQERYSSRFGLPPNATSAVEEAHQRVPLGPPVAQDRYASHFDLQESSTRRFRDILTSGPGAEQDRYALHWGLKEETAENFKRNMTSGPGAEQERYAGHWGLDEETAERFKRNMTSGPGAEQERYGAHFSFRRDIADEAKDVNDSVRHTVDSVKEAIPSSFAESGAEQDRYGARFGLPRDGMDKARDAADRVRSTVQGTGRSDAHTSTKKTGPKATYASGTVGVVGILQSTLLPTFALNSGLSLIAYATGRYTDRVDVKDALYPASPILNAWWMAIGRRMYFFGIPFSRAWNDMAYPERLLLGGVTAWGLRLMYHLGTRNASRGHDDPRYEPVKKQPEFWNRTALKLFFPEAAFSAVLSLPFTLAFRHGPALAFTPIPEIAELTHSLAIFLFGAGLALETVADAQLAEHQKVNSNELNRMGAWSIVRHPNYLGDVLVHASFPLLLYSCGLLHPIGLVAPVANYVVLRYIGGDAQTEKYQEEKYRTANLPKYQQFQEYRREKNAFWPSTGEFKNPWFLAVGAFGIGCVVLERGVREYLLR